MNPKRVSAVAIAVLFGLTSCACMICAHEDEGDPMIITAPSGTTPMSCAVFYADNMVYAPQWRLDNYVRIETMVIDMTDYDSARDIMATDVSLYPGVFEDGLAQQAAIIADSATILPMTKMVSVSYIEITITSDVLDEDLVFAAGWDPLTGVKVIEERGLGREVNKAGHVIYGTLWDTTGLDEGVYTVETRLGCVVNGVGVIGQWYSVDYAIAHLYNPEGEEGELLTPDHPFSDLVEEDNIDYSTYKIGVGGVGGGVAWIVLGPLIPQGSGGGNGGESGGNGGGNGNGNGGNGGNDHGNGHRARGK
ncbi:MAG: hypothetical protein KKE24_04695 [Candidatus Thermoplasmatota archaeon]|nr:hypothetical protein [Candidatus Thermoplasmatota archaeon]